MRVLIVEDEGLIANNLAGNLRRSGYEVSGIAPSGEEALDQIKTLKPDLVLMDIHLSGKLDGIETAERVRSAFSIPVIFLTAHADGEVLDRAKRTYPFGYLIKPIRHVDLTSAVEVALYKHEMERKLRQREAWLDTTLRCAGDGVIVTDAGGRIEFLNDLAKRILCLHDRDVIGEAFCEAVRLEAKFTGTPAGDLVQLAILQGSTMSIGRNLVLAGPLDQEVDLEGEIALSEIDGSIVGAVFTFRDVTVRNHRDNQSHQDLGTRVCARLAGAVAAELRTLLQDSSGDNNRASCESIGAAPAGSISRIVEQLDVVRVRNASFPQAFNLNALILDTYRELLSFNIELTSRLEPKLSPVYADPIQIKQAIDSLILHAQKCLPAGGAIHITTRNCAFERCGRKGEAEDYVRLTIANPGSRMEADEAEQLFEPFSGADPSGNKLDLTLFIVHEIIGGAGGSIRAEASPSKGMSFQILLPRIAPIKTLPSSPEPRPQGPGILLLHADHAIRAFLSDCLEREHYEAFCAANFGEALDWIAIHPDAIAVLILDLSLCPLPSPALTQQISVWHPRMRIIATADNAIDTEVKKVWTTLGARFLEKPFRLDELLETVNDLISEGHPREASVIQLTHSGTPSRPFATAPEIPVILNHRLGHTSERGENGKGLRSQPRSGILPFDRNSIPGSRIKRD